MQVDVYNAAQTPKADLFSYLTICITYSKTQNTEIAYFLIIL